jgi:hypothetical protein
MNENIKHKFLNLRSNIKDNMLWAFFFSDFIQEKKSKTSQTYFLILKAKRLNSKVTMDSSSIKLSKEIEISISFLNFK